MEKLEVWQLSRNLCKVYGPTVMGISNFEFRNQMVRSMISITSNIAEGYGRQSPRDYARFLKIAIGSLNEFESQCHFAYDLKIIDEDYYKSVIPEVKKNRRKILALIKVISAKHNL